MHKHRTKRLTLGCVAGVSIAMFAVDADASDALHCFKITDRALAGAARSDLGGDVPPGCSIVRGAALACMRASITDAGHEAADGLLFDRLCYEVRCSARAAASEPSSSDATTRLDDALGGHTFGRDAADLVCTPATITIATEQSVQGKGAAHGGSAEGSAAAKEVTLRQCGDFSADNSISASDALGVLKVAIGSKTCLPCVCDVDKSGTFTATDALTVLKKAVGQAVTLNCDPDGNPVTWTGGGDGTSWEDPANWNLSTRIPNLCDDVTIPQTGFTVVHGDDDNGALRINASSSLDLDAGILELRDTVLVNGTFRVSGGTLTNATVLSPTAGLTAATAGDLPMSRITTTTGGGLLDGVTLEGDLDLSTTSASVRVQNGLTVNGTANMANGTVVHFQSGDQTLDGAGEFVFGAIGNKYLLVDNGTTLTIAPTITIHGAIGQVGSSGGIVNEGIIDSDQPGEIEITSTQGWTNQNVIRGETGGDLRLSGTWTNNSQVSIADSGTLTLLGTWTNAGTITSTDSTVSLGGTFTLAALGDFQRSGGTVNLTGTFINSTDLVLDATTGNWNLLGGTIQGGSVSGTGGAKLVLTTGGGLLDGVTMDSDMDLSATSASVRVQNGLTVNGTANMANGTVVHFQSGDQTLDGAGEFVFGAIGNKYLLVDNGTTLTIAPTITIHGAIGQVGSSGGLINQGIIDSDQPGEIEITSTQGWTNQNVIRGETGGDLRLSGTWTNNSQVSIADSGTLTLLGTWTNAGTITSTDSTVSLGGTFTLAALGDFQRSGGTVNLTGTFINSTDLVLDATTGNWNLLGGTIQGGSVSGTGGAKLVLTTGGGLLDGVTMDSDMDLSATSASVRVQNGLTVNGTANMANGTVVHFQSGDQTLDGAGEFVFGAIGNKYLLVDSGTTLTIAPTITIHGAIGQVGSSGGLINQGIIDSDQPGEIEITSTQGWTNQNVIRGETGGDLRLSGTWTNNSQVSIADSGTLTLLGTWTNAGTITSTDSTVSLGGTFTLAALGDFQRSGGTVNLTGTFINSTDLVLDATTGNWNLLGGTIQGGSVSGTGGAKLVLTTGGGLLDGVTMDSDMDLSATSASVRVQNGLTVNGTANMANGTVVHFQSGDQTLDGAGEFVFGAIGNKYLLVDSGTTLTIAPTITIHGAIGQVGSSGGLINQGIIDSDQPGEIEITSTQGWTNDATMRASGGDLGTSGTGTNSGTIEISAGQKLTARNGFVQDGAGTLSIEIAGTSSFGQVKVTGAATLAGTLDVTLGGGFSPSIGDTFAIMTFGSHAGDFATVNGLDIGGGKRFDRTFTATEMILEVVPQ